MAEKRSERQFGINTAQIKKSNSAKFYHYQGASYLVLLKILPKIFQQTHTFTFFDIGCGKGRAIFVAETSGYNNMVGIDLDEELVLAANENSKIYKKRQESKITFLKSNALEFDYKNEPTVYFLFNPFNEEILKGVLDKILNATSSETLFIYMNPKHIEVFDDSHFDIVDTIKTKWYIEAVIYKIKRG